MYSPNAYSVDLYENLFVLSFTLHCFPPSQASALSISMSGAEYTWNGSDWVWSEEEPAKANGNNNGGGGGGGNRDRGQVDDFRDRGHRRNQARR